MQHDPGNIHQSVATPRYSATPWNVLIHLPNVLTRYRNDGGVRKPSIFHLSTSFPKQILTPSCFKLILLINNGIDWKDHNSCSFWAENFGRSLEGQGGQQGAVKYSIQSFKWKPTTCANPTNSATARNCKRLMRLLLAANNQATRRNKNNQKLPRWVQAATDMHPACPNKKQNHLQNSLLRRTQFWVRKTFSKPAWLKRASLVPSVLEKCFKKGQKVVRLKSKVVPPGRSCFGSFLAASLCQIR